MVQEVYHIFKVFTKLSEYLPLLLFQKRIPMLIKVHREYQEIFLLNQFLNLFLKLLFLLIVEHFFLFTHLHTFLILVITIAIKNPNYRLIFGTN